MLTQTAGLPRQTAALSPLAKTETGGRQDRPSYVRAFWANCARCSRCAS
jgi:hypothetical protein